MVTRATREDPKPIVNKTITSTMNMLEEFRKVDSSITANAITAFIHIATNQGITGVELQKKMGLNNSTVVRIVASMSSHHRGGKDGYDLIRYKEDFLDRRVKHLFLTPRGDFLWQHLTKALGVLQ